MGQNRRIKASQTLITLLIWLTWLSISGCLPQDRLPDAQEQGKDIASNQPLPAEQRLERDLVALLGHQDEEAGRLAQVAFQRTRALSQRYGVIGFSLFNNFLVNLGFKNRGLCCHWTKDLLQILKELKLEKFRLIWAVSNYGSLREHSSIAVVPTEKGFAEGLILDPWRNAGKLYWSKIDQDSYKWRPHPGENGKPGSIDCEANLQK